MIKYITLHIELLAIFILLMLISSCSITKCRYSSGFNIGFGGKSHETSNIKRVKKQTKKTEFCLTNLTDSNLIETSIKTLEKKTILYGGNKETEVISTLSNKSIAPKLLHKKTKNIIASKIKNTKVIPHQKPQKTNYSIQGILREILNILLLCLSIFIIIIAAIIGIVFLFVGLIEGFNPFLILLGVIFVIVIAALLIEFLSQLFGYPSNEPRIFRILRFFRIFPGY